MDFQEADAIRRNILDNNPPEVAAIQLGQLFQEMDGFFDALHNREIAPGVHISNPGPDATRMTERYIAGVGATANRYVEGMLAPRRNPVEAAIRAKGKWAGRVQEAIQQNAYEAGVRAQNYSEGVEIATSDGGAAWSAGATKRQSKVQRKFAQLAPLLGGVSQAIQNMAQDTDAQRAARLMKARELMINVGKQMKRGGGGG